MLDIVFFGSSKHSLVILKTLLNIKEYSLTAVVTKSDKPVGRGQLVTPNPVSQFAKQNNLLLLQPDEFTPQFKHQLASLKAQLGLCVAYGPPFFDAEMIDIFPLKIVNIHPSPLPKYRGATPGPWQIINGEKDSAVSFFVIDLLPDHGPLISQIPFCLENNDTAESFYEKAFDLAAANLHPVLNHYSQNPHKLTPQDHSQKTYFPRLNKEKAQIDWSETDDKISRFIRALLPWPVAWTYITDQKGKKLTMKILSAKIKDHKLILDDVQVENKNPSKWAQISRYYQLIK